jgi:hypothetical protein
MIVRQPTIHGRNPDLLSARMSVGRALYCPAADNYSLACQQISKEQHVGPLLQRMVWLSPSITTVFDAVRSGDFQLSLGPTSLRVRKRTN